MHKICPKIIPRELAHFLHVSERVPAPSRFLDVEGGYSVFTAITFDSNTETHKLKLFDPVKLHVTKGNNGTSIRSRCWDIVLWLLLDAPASASSCSSLLLSVSDPNESSVSLAS